jgi:hypothetical protein
MGEVIQFISKSERERILLIRRARAIYESIFPSTDPASSAPGKEPASPVAYSAKSGRGDEVMS